MALSIRLNIRSALEDGLLFFFLITDFDVTVNFFKADTYKQNRIEFGLLKH